MLGLAHECLQLRIEDGAVVAQDGFGVGEGVLDRLLPLVELLDVGGELREGLRRQGLAHLRVVGVCINDAAGAVAAGGGGGVCMTWGAEGRGRAERGDGWQRGVHQRRIEVVVCCVGTTPHWL